MKARLMTRKYGLHKCLQLGLAGLLGCLSVSLLTNKTQAQQSNIVPDSTLGTESSQVIGNFQGQPIEVITGGAIRQINLFHSFGEFNISEGRAAYFFSPSADIQNILARVTGNNPSEILGRLGTFGSSNPNVFLINPNGIVFGKDASLDVQGSFVGTTANGVQFGNQGVFSATNPQAAPLLTINPSILFFNQINQNAAIQNNSIVPAGISPSGMNTSGLRVPDRKSLLLVGSDINMDGGRLRAYGGRVELGGLSAPGNINLQLDDNNFSLTFPENVTRADVSLKNAANINVSASDGGDIIVNARNIDILEESVLIAGIGQGLGTPETVAGDITLNATGEIKVAGVGSGIYNFVNLGAKGNGGNITINSSSLTLEDSALLAASNLGQGNAGNIIIDARENVLFDGANAYSGIGNEAVGNAGNISIKAGLVSLSNNTYMSASTSGRGNAGIININARDSVSFDQKSYAYSLTTTEGVGKSGNVNINARSLSVKNGSELSASSFGRGDAGNLTINASDTVHFDGADSAALSILGEGVVGKAGGINITTKSLFVTNNAGLSASTSGRGDAGNVNINASDIAFFDVGSQAFALVNARGVGKAGTININTRKLSVNNGSQLSASSFGQGDAGNVTINASDTVNFDGAASAAFSISGAGAVGKGGGVNITTGLLSVTNGAFLTTSTLGRGDAGNVSIDARDTVVFDGIGSNGLNSAARSLVLAGAVGNGGKILINTGSVFITNGAGLEVSTAGKGNAGNVIINASDTVSIDRSDGIFSIVKATGAGTGGDINITTGSFFLNNGAQLASSTFGRGDAGNVFISASGSVSISGNNTGILSDVESKSEGNGANINIKAASLSISDGAQLVTSVKNNDDNSVGQPFNQGNAGNVNIDVTGAVAIAGIREGKASGIRSNLGRRTVGKGGNITISSGSLSVTDDARISTSTFGEGNAGNIFIQAKDSASFSNGFIFSSVEEEGLGKGGEINVTSHSLSLTNGAQFVATSRGAFAGVEITSPGNPSIDFFKFSTNSIKAGNIQINATDGVNISGFNPITGNSSGLFTYTVTIGNSGNITVNTDVFRISDSALLDARTYNFGDGGNITVNARIVEASNGGQLITTTTGGGNAGKIIVNAKDQVIVSDTYINPENTEAQLLKRFPEDDANSGFFVRSSGFGVAGDIEVNSPKVTLDKQGRFIAESASGNGGNIKLGIRDLLLMRRGGQISTNAGTAQAGGNGGNININSKFIIAIPKENSDISANAFEGRGGNVEINSQGIFGIEARPKPTEKSDITASSELGVSGAININVPDTSSIQNSFTELPPVIDANALIANSCISRGTKRQENSFTITGSGALTTNRPGVLVSNYITGEVRGVETTYRPWKKGDPIIEPQGLYRLNNGQLLLSRECS
ncbi:MAG: filamentous hemagglutinin N-terminal domain-containing protein [Nostoc sp. DedQUE05]|uniref:two-partner secretion domain-containing protein n=1 Tax=Nostoc sp. DedQUE05 TaxID=3075391 RepID=UPI002AD46D94|nr:filamentous hemagglutinin N-terminal domain-containing protein [Nostoc sp. DedQUE05]MDZ8096918.1 filamentous hemagglutinin N-terminal domain-containing protein [Nostoc sp. DedQUE05]